MIVTNPSDRRDCEQTIRELQVRLANEADPGKRLDIGRFLEAYKSVLSNY